MKQASVLICGAGPTGLVLALWLTKAGIPVRIIDAAVKPGTTSRATVVQARVLEFYRQLGIAGRIVSAGIKMERGSLWVRGEKVGTLPFGDAGKGISAFPYVLVLPQDQHEELLTQELAALGVLVERSTRLMAFEETEHGIRATISLKDGSTETCDAAYLAGCDGAHSTVRHSLDIGFPGGTYENMFYVADLVAKGEVVDGQLHAAIDKADFILVFPMQGVGRVRLIGAIRPGEKEQEGFGWDDVSQEILLRMNLEVLEVKWFSTYHVHHRVAEHFRKGRAFLLGDAGHIHSPVGGQGMNTGISDAVNLGWKLAAVLGEGAPPELLDTYEPERIAFAHTLVESTDRAFTFIEKRSALATFVRNYVSPPLVTTGFGFAWMRKLAYRTLSQTRIQYRNSMLNLGEAGDVHAGDRLPWVELDVARNGEPDNYAPLDCMCWQIHVYGKATEPVQRVCKERSVPLCLFPVNEESELKEGIVYVVRPDGYVGAVIDQGEVEELQGYFDRWGIGKMQA